MAIVTAGNAIIVEGEVVRNVAVRTGQALFADSTLPQPVQNAAQCCATELRRYILGLGAQYGVIRVRLQRYKGQSNFGLSVVHLADNGKKQLCTGWFETDSRGTEGVLHGSFGSIFLSGSYRDKGGKPTTEFRKTWEFTVDIGHINE